MAIVAPDAFVPSGRNAPTRDAPPIEPRPIEPTPAYAVIERIATIPGRRAFMRQLAQRVRERRVQLGLKQSELAAAVGWSQAAVSRLEHDANPNIPFLHLNGIVEVLGLTEYGLPGPPEPMPNDVGALDDEMARYVAACARMSPELRAHVASRMEALLAQGGEAKPRQQSSHRPPVGSADALAAQSVILRLSVAANGARLTETGRRALASARELAELLERPRLSPLWAHPGSTSR